MVDQLSSAGLTIFLHRPKAVWRPRIIPAVMVSHVCAHGSVCGHAWLPKRSLLVGLCD